MTTCSGEIVNSEKLSLLRENYFSTASRSLSYVLNTKIRYLLKKLGSKTVGTINGNLKICIIW